MTTTRERNAALAVRVSELLEDPTIKVKVTGGAANWQTIKLSSAPPAGKMKEIERALVTEKRVGTYWPDWGPAAYDDDGKPWLEPMVHWDWPK